jgi:hypothetical protein
MTGSNHIPIHRIEDFNEKFATEVRQLYRDCWLAKAVPEK